MHERVGKLQSIRQIPGPIYIPTDASTFKPRGGMRMKEPVGLPKRPERRPGASLSPEQVLCRPCSIYCTTLYIVHNWLNPEQVSAFSSKGGIRMREFVGLPKRPDRRPGPSLGLEFTSTFGSKGGIRMRERMVEPD